MEIMVTFQPKTRFTVLLPYGINFFTSRVSGRGYKNGAVCVCVCVCLSVCLSVSWRSHGWTVWRTVMEFGTGIDLDNVSDEFKGQCQRPRSLGPRKRFFPRFSDLSELIPNRWPMVWRRDVMAWRRDVTSSDIGLARGRYSNTLVFFFSFFFFPLFPFARSLHFDVLTFFVLCNERWCFPWNKWEKNFLLEVSYNN